MAAKLKVTYVDGREEIVLVTPRAQVMTERQYSGINQNKGVEQAYYLAWQTLHSAGKEPADFDHFLDLIADAESVTDDGDGVEDPTGSGQPLDGSSASA